MGAGVEIDMLSDAPGMGEQLGRVGVFFRRDIARFLKQRHVDVGFDIALRAGIAVPVPGAAEIAGLLDDADILDTRLVQLGRSQQAAKAAADHDGLDSLGHGIADERAIDIRIIDEAAEIALDLDILAIAARVDPLLPLFQVFLSQPRQIQLLFGGRCGVGHC